MGKKFSHSLKVYTLKEFRVVLAELGFTYHHRNSAHLIFADSENHYVTVPDPNGEKKEINAMMTTVILQRIKHNQCRRL